MSDRIQIRRDTSSNWSSVDPVLSQGEIGYETDTGKLKIGDGSTTYSGLGYYRTSTDEEIQDVAGGMFSGNTETFITGTYQDADGTIDLVVPVKDEDTMSSNSDTHLATQQSVKAYTDNSVKTAYSKSTTLLEPDQVQGVSDAIPLFPIDSTEFDSGITVTDVLLQASSAVSASIVLEEWTDPTTHSSDVVTVSLSSETETTETSVNTSISNGSILMVDLDATDVNWYCITIFYTED